METKQVWFITGATSGFGRAFAEVALDAGHRVVVTGREKSKLDELSKVGGDRVLALALDVTDAHAVQGAVEQAHRRFGRLDVVVNNAGYAVLGGFEETSDAELRAQMETNFFGAMHVTRAALPVLRAQRSGAIVNISSLGGQLSFAGFSAYSASKFALEGVSEALAAEVAPFGIKVLIVEPGAFRTDFAGGGMRTMPVMPEYSAAVGGTRDFARKMHGTQQGDPKRAAHAIMQALASPDTPLRLQLGADAVSSIKEHSEKLLRDLSAWEDVARATSFARTA